jgi:peptidoglycan/LPS O-acetylase OafA/YrhL
MRFGNIQALRSVAAVVVAHTFSYSRFQVGLTGNGLRSLASNLLACSVPVFFAASGFVLTHNHRTTPVGRFVVQRLSRISTPFWVAAALTAHLLPGGGTAWGKEFFAGLSLFPCGSRPVYYPLGIEWTLVHEVWFSLRSPGWRCSAGAGCWSARASGWRRCWSGRSSRPPRPTHWRRLPQGCSWRTGRARTCSGSSPTI